jgi:hypothetical protein
LREAQDRVWEGMRKAGGWINSRVLSLKRKSGHVRLGSGVDQSTTLRSGTQVEGREEARSGDVELEHRI